MVLHVLGKEDFEDGALARTLNCPCRPSQGLVLESFAVSDKLKNHTV
jgi:hypothetical protein